MEQGEEALRLGVGCGEAWGRSKGAQGLRY